jgi:Domain of unknown function (DUF5666)
MKRAAQALVRQARLALLSAAQPLALFAALLLAACTSPAPAPRTTPAPVDICASGASATNPLAPGSGGTGAPLATGKAGQEGLGGTGLQAQLPSNRTGGDGIGGTGSPAQAPSVQARGPGDGGSGDGIGGTGIVGVVTGFASICVNGLELHYAPGTPVFVGQQGTSVAALQVGQVVAVRASDVGLDKLQSGTELQAQRIVVLHAAVGPITQLGSAGRFAVMGQEALALAPEDMTGLRLGDWVRVSGHRTPSGEIRASRVQGIAARSEAAQVMGPASAVQAQSLRVGGTTVLLGSALAAQPIANGREVAVQGQWDGTRLRAQSISLAPTRASLGAVNYVLLEGFVYGVQGQELRLGYESLQIPGDVRTLLGGASSGAAAPSLLQAGQRVQVRARVEANQTLVVDALRINNESGSRGSNAATGSDDSGQGRGRGRGRSGSSGSGDDGDSGQGRGRGRSGGDSGSSGGSSGGSSSGSSGGSGSGKGGSK